MQDNKLMSQTDEKVCKEVINFYILRVSQKLGQL